VPAPEETRQKKITTKTGKEYLLQRPNIKEAIEIGVTQSRLLDGQDPAKVDKWTMALAAAVATLNTVIKEPADLDFEAEGEPEDVDEVMDIYNQYLDWVEFFRNPGGDATQPEPAGDGEVLDTPVLVPSEVQPPAERREVPSP
jgi:hypothetical protein